MSDTRLARQSSGGDTANRTGGIRALPRQHPLAQVCGRREGQAETAEGVLSVYEQLDAGAAAV